MKVLNKFKASNPNLNIQGFYTSDIREGSERVGFQVVTLDGRRGPLASSKNSRYIHCRALVYKSAFAISGYASTEGRNCKPFNSLLGETYEADYPDKGVRFFSEKVSHHPVIVACHCEGKGWKFWGDSNLKSKFWGRSIQLDPVGILTLEFDDGEVFQWSKVTTSIYNLIFGNVYCDHYGTMRIQGNRDYSCKLKFKEQSIIDRNPHQVQGIVQDKSGKTMATLFGKWDESMHYVSGDWSGKGKSLDSLSDARLLWQRQIAYQAAVYALLITAMKARFTSCNEERNDPSKVHIVLSPKLNLLLDSIETQLNTRNPKLVTWFKIVKLPNLALYFIPFFKKSSEYGRRDISGVAEVIHSICFCAAVDKLAERVSCPRFTLSIPEILGELMDLSYNLVSMDRLHSLASKAGVEQEFLAHFGSKVLPNKESREVAFWIGKNLLTMCLEDYLAAYYRSGERMRIAERFVNQPIVPSGNPHTINGYIFPGLRIPELMMTGIQDVWPKYVSVSSKIHPFIKKFEDKDIDLEILVGSLESPVNFPR
ncbi:hypothetical protein GIB67_005198 [Kingdonia uniflora]|uniref:Uncharacterized protein n=1 Tax=Kingdonia uniflora TaxID=39325 RepID=A0A7J7NN48_9MAGN|nr:hypothetical protein GIB67_005198 [Kingdonia uniflora]